VPRGWRARGPAGVRYARSELPKSQLYLEILPLFTRGLVAVPDHKRLLRELKLLERRTHRSGKDTIDHGKHGSDDYANAVCGVLHDLSSGSGYLESFRIQARARASRRLIVGDVPGCLGYVLRVRHAAEDGTRRWP
jgi:hypothetical protein